ncbi:MAG: site-2 protease family protein [Chloroflexi bacterium]|nr:site-2 protease family protein [Chloroflexota bacterium]
MLFNQSPEEIIASLIALGVAMTIHEWSHNYVGWRMGDPEPVRLGRLTLNPLVHINWIGWLMFAFIGFGILGAAPISPYRMPRENRRWRWMAAVAAGPVSNLLLAIVFMLVVRILGFGVVRELPDIVNLILGRLLYFNAILFFFNLLPLFPIDGWHIVYALLPPQLAVQWEKYQSTTQLIFFGLLLLSFVPLPGIPNLFGILIGQPTGSVLQAGLGDQLFIFYIQFLV